MIEMYGLSNTFKFKNPPVEETSIYNYIKDRAQNSKKVTKRTKYKQNLIKQRDHRLYKK